MTWCKNYCSLKGDYYKENYAIFSSRICKCIKLSLIRIPRLPSQVRISLQKPGCVTVNTLKCTQGKEPAKVKPAYTVLNNFLNFTSIMMSIMNTFISSTSGIREVTRNNAKILDAICDVGDDGDPLADHFE